MAIFALSHRLSFQPNFSQLDTSYKHGLKALDGRQRKWHLGRKKEMYVFQYHDIIIFLHCAPIAVRWEADSSVQKTFII